jgi:gamma-glutamyltranspeptidase/glutathione hydrolase
LFSNNLLGVDETMSCGMGGIVSVSNPIAAKVGRDVLKEGGNAVDAAIAIQFSLNVVEPYMSGIGGGGYMLIYNNESDKVTTIDGREKNADKINMDYFEAKEKNIESNIEARYSGNAVAVPGTLKQLDYASKKYGTIPISKLIDPAIRQAEKGIKVNWATDKYTKGQTSAIKKFPGIKKVFMPNDSYISEGDILIQKDLAKTFKLIKEKGVDEFYSGEIGKALVKEVQKQGGTLTLDDLKNYLVEEKPPVTGNYRGYTIASMGPSSSGGITLIQLLKIMENFNLKEMGAQTAAYFHHFIEAMHLAYADRAKYIADENFVSVPVKGLIDERYIKERSEEISPKVSSPSISAGNICLEDNNEFDQFNSNKDEGPNQTTHISVLDQWGNMVSFTTSIGQIYGSGIMVPDYGFLLANTGSAFQTHGINKIEPGKKAVSSMTPTIILKNNKPIVALGSPGATTIIASVAQTIINMIDFEMPIYEAILAPRVYSSVYPKVEWEIGISRETRLGLLAKGHALEEDPEEYIGDVHAVLFDRENNGMYGGTDDTREGTVLAVDGIDFVTERPNKYQQDEQEIPFTLKINNISYPYTSQQKLLKNDKCYIEKKKLLLGLGTKHLDDFNRFAINLNNEEYLCVNEIGEYLQYKVEWDSDSKILNLYNENMEKMNSNVQDYYRFEKVHITR